MERQRKEPYRWAMAHGAFPILFITATRIGDAVLSSGLIKRLLDEIPNARFTIVAGKAAAPLFSETPRLDRIIVMEKDRNGGHWFKLWREVRHRKWGLIVDLRSATSGVGSYTAKFDHLAEVVGKHADAIVAARASEKVNGH